MRSQRGAATASRWVAAEAPVVCLCVCGSRGSGRVGWRGAVAAAEVHGAVRGVDVGGGYGPGFALRGSPWREARPSLKLSGSESEREREGGGGRSGKRG